MRYDQDLVSYGELLRSFFNARSDYPQPQGNDIGSQYRSAVFFNNLEEKIQIEDCINQMQKEGVFEDPIVTEVNTECPFYPAEIEHHDYYNQNKDSRIINL